MGDSDLAGAGSPKAGGLVALGWRLGNSWCHAGIALGSDQGTLSFAAEGGAAEVSGQKAPPLGPGRPPRMKTYGAVVAARNCALPLAFSMPGVN